MEAVIRSAANILCIKTFFVIFVSNNSKPKLAITYPNTIEIIPLVD